MKEKARSAVFWSALDIIIRQGMSFAVTIVMARLLLPSDFGTIALLGLFIGIAGLFANAGLGSALIQRQDISHIDESTVFWFNLFAALLMALLLVAIAPWIADFFEIPILIPLTWALAVNIFIGSFATIHITLMSKRLDFKKPMIIGVTSTLVSGCVGVYMARAGFGIWALVAQNIAASLMTSYLFWLLNSWRPLYVFSFESFKRLFGFSGWLFLSWLLGMLYERGYSLVIGKMYGTHDLGIYNRAENSQQLATNMLTNILSKVTFPLFSSINHNHGQMLNGMRMVTRLIMLIMAPCMLGLAVLAEPITYNVFGEQWTKSAPILQVLCIVGLLFPLHVINLDVLQAQGHSYIFFRLEIIKKIIGVAILFLGSFYGLMGIAWSQVCMSIVALFINSHYTKKFLQYGISAQINDCLTSLIFATIMAGFIYWLDSIEFFASSFELVFLIVIGAITYFVLNIIFLTPAFKDLITFFKSKNLTIVK
jgi:O-antigen/teichoic acid export membrane protein